MKENRNIPTRELRESLNNFQENPRDDNIEKGLLLVCVIHQTDKIHDMCLSDQRIKMNDIVEANFGRKMQ